MVKGVGYENRNRNNFIESTRWPEKTGNRGSHRNFIVGCKYLSSHLKYKPCFKDFSTRVLL
jgi:hypothetical protein